MNILMAASEMSPFARTGTFADDMLELPGALQKQGHEVSVVLPYYRCIRENKAIKVKKSKVKFSVPVGSAKYACEIFETRASNGVQVFLVARDEFFDRTGLYGADDHDYQDNSARFIFFTKCVLELAKRIDPAPQILHAHSWQTALLPVFVRDQRLSFITVLTPHTLLYQGNFWSYDFGLTNLPGDQFSARGVEYYGSLNCLKAGLLYSDAVVLSNSRLVSEAQTSESGCGLENVIREQSYKISGIPGGLDYASWDSSKDASLAAPFTIKKTEGRKKNTAALLQELGLAPDAQCVFAISSEACKMRGLDVLFSALDRLPAENLRFVLLGPTDEVEKLEIARRKHAGIFSWIENPTDALVHKTLAGSDVFLVPGPLNAESSTLLLAQHYGCVPLVAACGGLRQFVEDYDPVSGKGNGFVFYLPTIEALNDGIRRVLNTRQSVLTWTTLMQRVMASDYSWDGAAIGYGALYEQLGRKAGLLRAA